MDWNLPAVAVFRAVAEARSFTRGAAVAGVSQPAASKQVAELERSLGVRLIERGSRTATLTHAGEVLIGYARQVDDTLAAARTALADLTAMRRGRLRIGATATIGTYLLPRALVYFRTRFPDIDVTVEVRTAAALSDRFDAGRLDVLLTNRHLGTGGLSRVFTTDEMIAVCAIDYVTAGRKTITLEELSMHRVMLRGGPRQTAGSTERLLRARQCRPQTVMRLPQTESVKQAALAGLGVAFVPRMAVVEELASGRLRRLAIKSFVLPRQCFWVERSAPKRASTVRAFECVLKHAIRGTLPLMRR